MPRRIGARVIRSVPGRTPRVHPDTWIDPVGAWVTIGHRAVVHACRVMDSCRIGIGAVVLDGAVIEEGAQVGAGSLVPPGKIVEAGWLVMGVPARPVRKMSAEELADILRNAQDYLDLWRRDYAEGRSRLLT